jgi:hypothetical protein
MEEELDEFIAQGFEVDEWDRFFQYD